jgi:hypothetical protein
MKRKEMLEIIQRGGTKTTVLACYFVDQKTIFENGHYDKENWRNPTVKEFTNLNLEKHLIYNAAKLADVKIKKGKILICKEKTLLPS